jgi:small-conductance mechanosensitive channel
MDADRVPLSRSLSEAVYWLVWLIFLPAILGALQLAGLLAPVVSMLEELLSYLPNLLAAGLVLLVGWFIARIAQRLTTSFLSAAGLDRLSDRVGLTSVMGSQTLSGVLGLIVFYLIIIPTFVAALNALGIQALTLPAANMLNIALGAIPNIIAAAVLLAIAYVVARLVAGLITNVLTAVGFNGILAPLGLGEVTGEGERTPSEIVGYLALVLIMFFAAIEGLALLGFEAVAVLLSGFLVFAAKVILGLIILAIGLYLANLATRVSAGRHPGAGRRYGLAPDGSGQRDHQPGLWPDPGRHRGCRGPGLRPGRARHRRPGAGELAPVPGRRFLRISLSSAVLGAEGAEELAVGRCGRCVARDLAAKGVAVGAADLGAAAEMEEVTEDLKGQ